MSSLWNKAKNVVTIKKLQGEIVLAQREVTARKGKFGVELYDLLSSEFVVETPGIFAACEDKIKGPYDRCKDDLESWQETRNAYVQQIEDIEVNRERTAPAVTAQDKLSHAGQWVSNAGNEGKLQAQIALLDRQMKQRKQAFGLEVFDDIMENAKPADAAAAAAAETGVETDVKAEAAVSDELSNCSEKEKKLEECVEQAKKDVAFIQRRVDFKQTQIVQLGGDVDEATPDANNRRSFWSNLKAEEES